MDFNLLDLFGGTSLGTGLFGAPGAGTLFKDMAVPGMPATGGLLRAGDDDMRAGSPPPGMGLLSKAGPGGPIGPGPEQLALGAPRGLLEGSGGSDTLLGGTITPPRPDRLTTGSISGAPSPPPIILPGPEGPTTSIPVAPGAPGGRVVESTSGTPTGGASPPIKIGATTAGGGTVLGGQPGGGGAVPPASPAGAPAAAPDPNAPQGSALDRLNAAMAKVPAIGAGKALQPANIGSAGQPHIPQGGAALFQALLEQHAKELPRPGGVPGLPDALKRRTQGGVF